MGLLAIPFDPAFGGNGQGAIELMLASQELGRFLGGHEFTSAVVMAGPLIARHGTPEQQQLWLPAICEGRLQVSLAFFEKGARYDFRQVRTVAASVAGGYVINGEKTQVMCGEHAQLLLVTARTDDGKLGLFAVSADTQGVDIHSFDTLDGQRSAHVRLIDVRLGEGRLIRDADLEWALDAGAAALCAQTVGAVEALMLQVIDHLKTRKQFGVALAKFQVLQHRVADMAIALEQLKSMSCAAAMAMQPNIEASERQRIVSAAKVLASQQGRKIGLDAIQLLGAMGMTDECRVGHYAKYLMVNGLLLGDVAFHLQRLVQLNSSPLTSSLNP
jgi:pimeloyl-CoA dehydrogenase